jgi:hypothetical protein
VRTVIDIAASPDGRTLLAAGRPGRVECYEMATLSLRKTFDFDIGGVNAIACAPDGFTFAVGGDKGLLVCDAE